MTVYHLKTSWGSSAIIAADSLDLALKAKGWDLRNVVEWSTGQRDALVISTSESEDYLRHESYCGAV